MSTFRMSVVGKASTSAPPEKATVSLGIKVVEDTAELAEANALKQSQWIEHLLQIAQASAAPCEKCAAERFRFDSVEHAVDELREALKTGTVPPPPEEQFEFISASGKTATKTCKSPQTTQPHRRACVVSWTKSLLLNRRLQPSASLDGAFNNASAKRSKKYGPKKNDYPYNIPPCLEYDCLEYDGNTPYSSDVSKDEVATGRHVSSLSYEIDFRNLAALPGFLEQVYELPHCKLAQIKWALQGVTKSALMVKLRKDAVQNALKQVRDYCEGLTYGPGTVIVPMPALAETGLHDPYSAFAGVSNGVFNQPVMANHNGYEPSHEKSTSIVQGWGEDSTSTLKLVLPLTPPDITLTHKFPATFQIQAEPLSLARVVEALGAKKSF